MLNVMITIPVLKTFVTIPAQPALLALMLRIVPALTLLAVARLVKTAQPSQQIAITAPAVSTKNQPGPVRAMPVLTPAPIQAVVIKHQ